MLYACYHVICAVLHGVRVVCYALCAWCEGGYVTYAVYVICGVLRFWYVWMWCMSFDV